MTTTDRNMQMIPRGTTAHEQKLAELSNQMLSDPYAQSQPVPSFADQQLAMEQLRTTPPDEPHDFIDQASDGRRHEHDEAEDWDSVPFRWIGIMFVGVIIGIAIFAGIIIGALT